jgi:hypothetical protein
LADGHLNLNLGFGFIMKSFFPLENFRKLAKIVQRGLIYL